MNVIEATARWFLDPANWSGDFGIPARLVQHLWVSTLALAIALVLALPPALVLAHARRAEFLAVSVANVGRALPSFAILGLSALLFISLGRPFAFWPSVITLVLLAIPPLMTNAYVGVREVDADTLEAARGMGTREHQLLLGIELPLAAPLIVVGFRTATVQVIATATLAAVVGFGGLGRFIIDGFATRDQAEILGGAVLVALLAVIAEALLGLLERAVTPRSVSIRSAPFEDVMPQQAGGGVAF